MANSRLGGEDGGQGINVARQPGTSVMLSVGDMASASTLVTGADLAEILNQTPEDGFPPVYATSKMVGLMELAAARLMRQELSAGELSVGVSLDISHVAATPIGIEVTAEARYVGRDGRLFVFEVSARDRGGEIGRGTHRRALVSKDRLMSGAVRRITGN